MLDDVPLRPVQPQCGASVFVEFDQASMVDSGLFVAESLTASTSAEFERGQTAQLLSILFRQFSRSGEPWVLGHIGKEGRCIWNTKPLHNSLDRPIAAFLELHTV